MNLRTPSPSQVVSTLSFILLSVFVFGCGGKSEPADPEFLVKDVDPKQVSMILEYQSEHVIVLDVRTAREFKSGHIEGAVNHDYNDPGFEAGLATIDSGKDVILHCASGGRSASALKAVEAIGVKKIYHLTGGMNAWRAARMPIKK